MRRDAGYALRDYPLRDASLTSPYETSEISPTSEIPRPRLSPTGFMIHTFRADGGAPVTSAASPAASAAAL